MLVLDLIKFRNTVWSSYIIGHVNEMIVKHTFLIAYNYKLRLNFTGCLTVTLIKGISNGILI